MFFSIFFLLSIVYSRMNERAIYAELRFASADKLGKLIILFGIIKRDNATSHESPPLKFRAPFLKKLSSSVGKNLKSIFEWFESTYLLESIVKEKDLKLWGNFTNVVSIFRFFATWEVILLHLQVSFEGVDVFVVRVAVFVFRFSLCDNFHVVVVEGMAYIVLLFLRSASLCPLLLDHILQFHCYL